MSKKNHFQLPEFSDINFAPGVAFARKAIWLWLPIFYLLISDSFYLRTYDSAQVKITLLQMGGFSLVGLWVSLLVLEGRRAFRKEDFVFLAPFLAYLIYVIISFCHAPYKGASVDDLVRYILYMSVSLIVLREFNESAINRLTRVLIVTASIAILYGFVQFLDSRFFPAAGAGPGLDPFIWRQAFATRIFSTYGNPNFFGNFLVLILPVIVTQYLKNRSVYLLPLIFLDLLCLYGTDTKGAWIGFGISTCVFAAIYIYFFTQLERKKILKTFLALAAAGLVAVALVLNYARKRPASINFRVATWLSTWEMVETHPLIGIGVGSFKVIYPAFRRPIIFHIEGKHNTETDHAEEEHLEQWMDNGLIGFGIYLWLIIFVTTVGLRGLNSMTATLKGNRPPPAAYDLLGYLTALLGMLFHNFTDVSMRFVSSGIFLGLLPGVIVNLARGQAIWELHYKEERTGNAEKTEGSSGLFYSYSLWALRAAAVAGVLYLAFLLIREFAELQGPLRGYVMGGEILQWWISWFVMLAVTLGLAYAFININLKGLSRAVPLVSLVTLLPVYYFWGWFKGDVYHNMAIFFSKQGKWEDAISYYKRVNHFDPYFIMPYYFVGNVFNDRFNMDRQYRKDWGDENEIPRTDFDRAMAAYETVRSIAPNYVQMHHQVGTLYMKMHAYYMNQGKPEEAARFLDKALARLNLYENLDPVYAPNYYRKAQVYIAKRDYPAAEREYLNNINAWKCSRPGHMHETPEGYTSLGNIEYAMGKHREAFEAYGKALALDPETQPAKSQYSALKQQFGPSIRVEPKKTGK